MARVGCKASKAMTEHGQRLDTVSGRFVREGGAERRRVVSPGALPTEEADLAATEGKAAPDEVPAPPPLPLPPPPLPPPPPPLRACSGTMCCMSAAATDTAPQ